MKSYEPLIINIFQAKQNRFNLKTFFKLFHKVPSYGLYG